MDISMDISMDLSMDIHIHGKPGISAIRSVDPENSTVQPNMKRIGRPLAEIWSFEIFQM